MDVILVHGGVENRCSGPCLTGLQNAAIMGYRALEIGVIEAVERAVIALEDDPLFNAGYGSVLNKDGEAEMDAAIIDGATGRCGAVAALQGVRNPVSVARKVMEETPHVCLAGSGALRFARSMGFEPFDPVTEIQRSSWERATAARREGKKLEIDPFTGFEKPGDTVGCVAVRNGRTAAASSTGGTFLKLPGRVGDTPVIGAGIWASPHGAAVCTGRGEAFIEIQAAGWALNLVAQGLAVAEAARAVIRRLNEKKAPGGILLVDRDGNAAAAHNTREFPVLLVVDGRIVEDFRPFQIERK